MYHNFIQTLILGSAIFSTIHASPISIRQVQCPSGQVYYSCANGYKGCYNTNVCNLPVTCDPKASPITMPEMHNIYIYPGVAPFPAQAKMFNIYKQLDDGGSEQQQVAVFRGIPSTAKTCTLGAQIAADRSFSVYDHGLMNVTQLTGLPSGNITVDTIQGLDSTRPPNQYNFQYWPQTPGRRVLNRIQFPCATEMFFRFAMADEIIPGNGGPGDITLEQDANNGFFLEYTC